MLKDRIRESVTTYSEDNLKDLSILALGDVKCLIKEEFYGNIKNGK